MRVVLQRVSEASVSINAKIYGQINQGLVILLGIEEADSIVDVDWLVQKISQMRIFSDNEGKMNLSLKDVDGSLLIISQFTLHASVKKGNRPSFIKAARPEKAIPLYEYFIEKCKLDVQQVKTGIFGADMKVSLVNDGPVTIVIDSKDKC
jgi:D-tyrosyl-tRNA(Tyr) deacylase